MIRMSCDRIPCMLPDLFSLRGKTAIVTGASYGLGVTFAEALAGAGANVVLAARSMERLEEVAARIGSAAIAHACDVADADQVAKMVAAACDRFGRVDVVVNNAGVATDGGIMPEKVPHDRFAQAIAVNLCGVWYCCREAGARMLADGRGGSIINVASVLGIMGQADLSPSYHASKAAVINLTRNLACSWGDRGVRVNALAPGWFPSEMMAALFSMPGFLDWANGLSPLGRVGKPEELIGPLLFLASDASAFVTGETLVVDGGISCGGASGKMPASYYQIMSTVLPPELAGKIVPTEKTGA
jgi:NAD(P)-dependent dehydrogenase (short-subunit alcohol dehydrogenase family)